MLALSTTFQNTISSDSTRSAFPYIATNNKLNLSLNPSMKMDFYRWDNLVSAPDISGLTNVTKLNADAINYNNFYFYWGDSAPFLYNVDSFACYTQIYIDAGSYVKFKIVGSGVNVKINTDYPFYLDTPSLMNFYTTPAISNASYVSFLFYGTRGVASYGSLAIQYAECDASGNETSEYRLINSHSCSSVDTVGSDIREQIKYVSNMRISRSEGQPAELVFDIPYSTTDGYYRDSITNSYVCDETGTHLRVGQNIFAYGGYNYTYSGTDTSAYIKNNKELIPRMSGYIHSISLNSKSSILSITVKDALDIIGKQFILNQPSPLSYWVAGYFTNTDNNIPDGVSMPIAYDRWMLHEAVRDLLINGDIPDGLMSGIRKYKNESGSIVDGGNKFISSGFRLEDSDGYNNSSAPEYKYNFDIGTTIQDAVLKMCDQYNYNIYIDEFGDFVLESRNNADQKIGVGSATLVDAILANNSDAVNGNGIQITNSGSAQFSFTGTGCAIIAKRSIVAGQSDNNNEYWSGTPSLRISIDAGVYNYHIEDINLYMDEDWYYNMGYYNSLSANPSIINLITNLPYNTYTLTITPLVTGYTNLIEQLWVYQRNLNSPVKTVYTYKSGNYLGTISDLDYTESIDTIRNDVIVIGERTGIWVASGELEETNEEQSKDAGIVYTNIHSRAVDQDSIYNENYKNYIGRRVSTYIQEKSITSEQRARWLSNSILNSYRNILPAPVFSIIGDPTLQLHDCVSVVDKKLNITNSNRNWIKSINETINKDGSWLFDIKVTDKEPFPSFEVNDDFDIAQYSDNYLIDISFTDVLGNNRSITGFDKIETTLYSAYNLSGYTLPSTMYVDNTTNFPSSGTILVSSKDTPQYVVINYTAKTSNSFIGCTYIYGYKDEGLGSEPILVCDRGVYASIPVGSSVSYCWNPYEADDFGNKLRISFKSIVYGRVRVGIKQIYGNYVSGLSSGGGLDENYKPKWQTVSPGEVLYFDWGGVDELGITQKEVDDDVPAGWYCADGIYGFYIEAEADSVPGTIITYNNLDGYTDKDGNHVDYTGFSTTLSLQDYMTMYSEHDTVSYTDGYVVGGNGRALPHYDPDGVNGFADLHGTSSDLSAYTKSMDYVFLSKDEKLSLVFKPKETVRNRKYYLTLDSKFYINNKKVYVPLYAPVEVTGFTSAEESGVEDFKLSGGNALIFNKFQFYSIDFYPLSKYNIGDIVPEKTFNDNKKKQIKAMGDGNIISWGYAMWLVYYFTVRDASGRSMKYADKYGRITDQYVKPVYNNIGQKRTWQDSIGGKKNKIYRLGLELYFIPTIIDEGVSDPMLYGESPMIYIMQQSEPIPKWEKNTIEASDKYRCWTTKWW